MCESEYAHFIPGFADNLNTDRQTIGGETAWQGDCWQANDGDEVAGFHPVNIGIHFLAINVANIFFLDAERGDLGYRQDKKIII